MKPQISKYFTESDKLQLFHALKKKTELGLIMALEMFDELLGEMVQQKRGEVAKIIQEMDREIQIRQLSDGKTPVAGKDYPTETQLYEYIDRNIKAPVVTEAHINKIVQNVKSQIKVKHGKTPRPGVDFPTLEQVKSYIDSAKQNPIEKTIVKETQLGIDSATLDAINKRFQQLEKLIRTSRRSKLRGGGDSVVAGSNITVTRIGGRRSIASTASGSGFTELTATGTIDSVNATFTFTQKPSYLVKDGVFMKENKGWTWSGSTATLSIPPDVDLYGVA